MFLHLAIPDFHLQVHQAAQPQWQRRPLAIAVDRGPTAPLLACSVEAQAMGVEPGQSLDEARRHCRTLAVVTPQGDWYRRAQEAVVAHALALTPRIGGDAGALDCALAGTERLWGGASGSQTICSQTSVDALCVEAERAAQRLVKAIARDLGLRVHAGIGLQRRTATVAARAAAHAGDAVHLCTDPSELDACPLTWLPGLDRDTLGILAQADLNNLGDIRQRGLPWLLTQTGLAHSTLVSFLLNEEDCVIDADVGPLSDPQFQLQAGTTCEAQRAATAEPTLTILAERLSADLRERHLASTHLVLRARRAQGDWVERTVSADRQWQTLDDLIAAVRALAQRLPRQTRWTHFDLIATDLCSGEAQQTLFDLPSEAVLTDEWVLAEAG